ncbi:hypothetical protein CAQUA_08150 [Corynebacterium aquatimens]|nr:hypothetical protein CAQUA_08150 [Corynebacterium aquatimens]
MTRRAGLTAAVTAVALLTGCTIGEPGKGDNGASGSAQSEEAGQPQVYVDPNDPEKKKKYAPPKGSGEPGAAVTDDNAKSLGASINQAIQEVVAQYGGQAAVGIANGDGAISVGDALDFPAWSTIKVPIAIAALRSNPNMSAQAASAIQVSDNEAAKALWASIDPAEADKVLAEGNSPVQIQREVTRPEFTPFGQTIWKPTDQAKFASNLKCIAGSEEVLGYMGQIAADQRYGLGQIEGARFKGGWGPTPDGKYVVRQFGLVPVQSADGKNFDVAIAITVFPASGTYQDGQAMANALVEKLRPVLKDAPIARC